MQETNFIQQNREKWEEFEQVLSQRNKDPDRLTSLFIETTDDLSYSRTYYGNRSIRVYLNSVAQQVYQAIYRNRTKTPNRWSAFWREDLPEALWHGRRALLVAFLVFTGGLSIGIVSSVHYPEFARIILGEAYVEMTEANIRNGDPMAVYGDSEPVEMFFRIAYNNIRVAFMAFVLGITFAIGTYYIVLYNGIMVGAFIYFFMERGLFREAFLAIMLHGTLELSMIVLSGAAGLVLARGLLFPGTYSRVQALIHSGRMSIKIMLAVSLFLLYAAIIESFATRFTQLPGIPGGEVILDLARLAVILLSLAIVLGYFVWYPWMRHRRGLIGAPDMAELPPNPNDAIELENIKSAGRAFTESFILFGRSARRSALHSLVLSLLFVALYGALTGLDYASIFETGRWTEGDFNPLGPLWVWDFFSWHLDFERFPLAFPALCVLAAAWLAAGLNLFRRHTRSRPPQAYGKQFIRLLPAGTMLCLPLLLPQWGTVLAGLFVYPLLFFFIAAAEVRGGAFPFRMEGSAALLRGGAGRMMSLFLMLLSIQWLCLIFLYSELAWMPLSFIAMNLPRFSWISAQLPYMLYTLLIAFLPSLLFMLTLHGSCLVAFSQREANEAGTLRSQLQTIGQKKRAYGLEKES